MPDDITRPNLPDKGARKAPDAREMRLFTQKPSQEGGVREKPAPADKFARQFSATLRQYPKKRELPNWLKGLIEKKATVEELTKTLHDRVKRAPSEENQEYALLLANEIARMKGGTEALAKYVSPELLEKLRGTGGNEQ